MPTTFSVDQARALLPDLQSHATELVRLRADLAEGRLALQRGEEPPGGLAALKAAEAHLQEAVDWIVAQGIQLKGLAPLLVDFPSERDGEPVLLCWLEGEPTLGWYHHEALGFAGRRPLDGGHR
jgi:hypothetical protein